MSLFNMLPNLPQSDHADQRLRHPELGGQYRERNTRVSSRSDRSNLLGSQFGVVLLLAAHQSLGVCSRSMSFATRTAIGRHLIANRLPSLLAAVGHIVVMRPKEKMQRVHAAGIVAVMAGKQTLGDRSVGQLPGHSVRADMATIQPERAVTVAAANGRCPLPTTIGLLDLAPKPCNILWGILRVHRSPLRSGAMLRAGCNPAPGPHVAPQLYQIGRL